MRFISKHFRSIWYIDFWRLLRYNRIYNENVRKSLGRGEKQLNFHALEAELSTIKGIGRKRIELMTVIE